MSDKRDSSDPYVAAAILPRAPVVPPKPPPPKEGPPPMEAEGAPGAPGWDADLPTIAATVDLSEEWTYGAVMTWPERQRRLAATFEAMSPAARAQRHAFRDSLIAEPAKLLRYLDALIAGRPIGSPPCLFQYAEALPFPSITSPPRALAAAFRLVSLWHPRMDATTRYQQATQLALMRSTGLCWVYGAIRPADGRAVPWSVLAPLRAVPIGFGERGHKMKGLEGLTLWAATVLDPDAIDLFGQLVAALQTAHDIATHFLTIRNDLLLAGDTAMEGLTFVPMEALTFLGGNDAINWDCLKDTARRIGAWIPGYRASHALLEAARGDTRPKVARRSPGHLMWVRDLAAELANSISHKLEDSRRGNKSGVYRRDVLERTAAIMKGVYLLPGFSAQDVKSAVAKRA